MKACLLVNNFNIDYCSCSGDKIDKNEIGAACSAYGEEERRMQGFGGET